MKVLPFVMVAAMALVACKKKKDDTPEATNDPNATLKTQIKTNYANLAFAVYDDAYEGALDLKYAIDAFVANPSQAGLDNAKQVWLETREVYGQSEIFRFVDGPIDNPSDGPEGLINSWPMDEAYVDYVYGSPNAGIINNLAAYPTIDATTIVTANQSIGEETVSTGYHAIEFLLWGQDLSASGPGNRPYTDYVTTGGGTNSNQARRGAYLKEVANILVAGLLQVRNAWDPAGVGNYRQTWMALDNATALRKMFNSMRVLSGEELAGERIFVAYENMNQEDEHSCFSDNTHRDIHLNALAISNLYTGTYVRSSGLTVTGYSIEDLMAIVSPAKNTQVLARFTTTQDLITTMGSPFDQAIVLSSERPKVLDVYNSLLAEQAVIVSLATDLNIIF